MNRGNVSVSQAVESRMREHRHGSVVFPLLGKHFQPPGLRFGENCCPVLFVCA